MNNAETTSAASGTGENVQHHLLDAKDRRQQRINRLLTLETTVVAVSLSIPGPDKFLPGSNELFQRGVTDILRQVPPIGSEKRYQDILGPFAVYQTRVAGRDAKEKSIAIEASFPAARLLDIDIYCGNGHYRSRSDFGIPPRQCLLCSQPAAECMRVRRHDHSDIALQAARLLQDLRP